MNSGFRALVAKERQSPEYNTELAVLDFCELVCKLMEKQGLNKKQLAEKAGLHPAQITRVLSGDHNVTIRTIGKIFWALDKAFGFSAIDIPKKKIKKPLIIRSRQSGRTRLPAG